jgi:hypothetical protein
MTNPWSKWLFWPPPALTVLPVNAASATSSSGQLDVLSKQPAGFNGDAWVTATQLAAWLVLPMRIQMLKAHSMPCSKELMWAPDA